MDEVNVYKHIVSHALRIEIGCALSKPEGTLSGVFGP